MRNMERDSSKNRYRLIAIAMSEEELSKSARSSRAGRTPNPSSSAISSQTTANRKYKTLSMPTPSNRKGELGPTAVAQPNVTKTEIYEALYGLNAGIQQFVNSLDFLDKAGFGLPFLNGYRILADEIRSAINFSTADAMTAIELRDYKELERQRAKFSFPPIGNLAPQSSNHD
jgi:hypothetical protein